MTKKQLRLISITVVTVLILSFVLYQIVTVSKADIVTQVALSDTVYDTIDTKCFVVRDEEYIENSSSGTAVSFVHNGDKVAAGDAVSIIFDYVDDADIYLRKNEIQKEIEHYKEVSSQANLHTVDIDSLNNKIDKELCNYLNCLDNGNYSSALESAEQYRSLVTGKQIATGTSLDYSELLVKLQNELTDLNNKSLSYSEIKSEDSGYFINGADGYERIIDYDKIDSTTVDDVESALKSSPKSIDSNVIGRTVVSFDWYILCSVKSSETVNLDVNDALYVNFPYSGVKKLPVSVYKIGERTGKNTLLVLKCSRMNEMLSDFRIEDIEIITNEYTGYKIKNTALRTVDGVKGVYVQSGNIITFKKIHEVYSNDVYSIVDNPKNDEDYISLYDNVVIKGVEMYDNKLV